MTIMTAIQWPIPPASHSTFSAHPYLFPYHSVFLLFFKILIHFFPLGTDYDATHNSTGHANAWLVLCFLFLFLFYFLSTNYFKKTVTN